MTGLEAAKAVDVAADALVKVLRASGPINRPSDDGSVWVYALDPTAPLGFRMFAAVRASSVGIAEPDRGPVPVAPIAPVAPMPQPPPIVVPPIPVPAPTPTTTTP
jgi:hypothetical protein